MKTKTKKIEGKTFYYIGYSNKKSSAEKTADNLREKRFPARVIKEEIGGKIRYSIWSSEFASEGRRMVPLRR